MQKTPTMIRKIGAEMCRAGNGKITSSNQKISFSQSAEASFIDLKEQCENKREATGQQVMEKGKILPADTFQKFDPSDLLFAEHGECGVISLNRPKVLNALNIGIVREILNKIKEWGVKKRFLVFNSLSDKAFCTGGDLRMMLSPASDDINMLARVYFKEIYSLAEAVNKCSIPCISLMHQTTMGTGAALSVHCKYTVVTENTSFGMPEVMIGFYPDCGGSHIYTRLPNYVGYYLGLTGTTIKGVDLLRLGFATHFVPSEKLPDLKNDLLASKAENIEVILHNYQPKDIWNTELSLTPHLGDINKCFSAPTVEEIISRLENDKSEWAKETLEKMRKACPLSLKIAHRVFQKAEKLSLTDCFQMDYSTSVAMCYPDNNFAEGIMKIVIEKTGNPVWKPRNLEDITEEDIANIFHQ